MAVVSFDPDEFREIYPQYADYTAAQLQFYFAQAELIVDNSEGSKVPFYPPKVMTRKIILYTIMCHFAELALRGMGSVGTISSASEGSVSVGYTTQQTTSNAWWGQTQCGLTAWEMLRGFMLGGRLYRGCFR